MYVVNTYESWPVDVVPFFKYTCLLCVVIVKALALGATGVLVGRMPIIGACLGGQEGVKHVLLNLKADTHCTMMNAGAYYHRTVALLCLSILEHRT